MAHINGHEPVISLFVASPSREPSKFLGAELGTPMCAYFGGEIEQISTATVVRW